MQLTSKHFRRKLEKKGKDKANWPGDLGNMGERYLRILCTILLTFLKVEIMSK